VQTVTRETNPLYWEIIEAFRKRTGCPVIVNTSFNVRGEPIVCTPADSYRCFMRTEMDYLVLETLVLSKDAYNQLNLSGCGACPRLLRVLPEAGARPSS
jgi:carbamoyltransferase